MGHRNRRMVYVGQPGSLPTPACADYGPLPGQEKEAVLEYMRKEPGAKSAFEIAARVGIPEQDARQHIEALHYEGCCVLDGELVYAL